LIKYTFGAFYQVPASCRTINDSFEQCKRFSWVKDKLDLPKIVGFFLHLLSLHKTN
jgi:hypothetical protein